MSRFKLQIRNRNTRNVFACLPWHLKPLLFRRLLPRVEGKLLLIGAIIEVALWFSWNVEHQIKSSRCFVIEMMRRLVMVVETNWFQVSIDSVRLVSSIPWINQASSDRYFLNLGQSPCFSTQYHDRRLLIIPLITPLSSGLRREHHSSDEANKAQRARNLHNHLHFVQNFGLISSSSCYVVHHRNPNPGSWTK